MMMAALGGFGDPGTDLGATAAETGGATEPRRTVAWRGEDGQGPRWGSGR